ncbi:hypothetical protein DITRI_Ditri16bG0114000 [Diplodiscus trichospermus]
MDSKGCDVARDQHCQDDPLSLKNVAKLNEFEDSPLSQGISVKKETCFKNRIVRNCMPRGEKCNVHFAYAKRAEGIYGSRMHILTIKMELTTMIKNYGPGSLKSYQCPSQCSRRCGKTQYHGFVPPGYYGNKAVCPCYNNWKTKEGGPKCP